MVNFTEPDWLDRGLVDRICDWYSKTFSLQCVARLRSLYRSF